MHHTNYEFVYVHGAPSKNLLIHDVLYGATNKLTFRSHKWILINNELNIIRKVVN